jgi:predicted RNase H-like nuclease (RuvC/YqgF family)
MEKVSIIDDRSERIYLSLLGCNFNDKEDANRVIKVHLRMFSEDLISNNILNDERESLINSLSDEMLSLKYELVSTEKDLAPLLKKALYSDWAKPKVKILQTKIKELKIKIHEKHKEIENLKILIKKENKIKNIEKQEKEDRLLLQELIKEVRERLGNTEFSLLFDVCKKNAGINK